MTSPPYFVDGPSEKRSSAILSHSAHIISKKYCNVTINLLKQMYDLHHRHICRPNLIDSFHGKL